MNSKELQTKLAEKMGWTQKETGELLTHYVNHVVSSLETDAAIPFMSFGHFSIKRREQRIMVNPATQKRSLIPPKLVIDFQVHSNYKHKIRTYPKK